MSVLRDAVRREMLGDNIQIVEFAESSDYCGKPLYPLQRVLLKFIFLEEMEGWEEDLLTFMINGGRGNEFLVSPDLRERRDWCRDQGYSHFTEVDLVGGRRSSKGHITGLAGAYKLWKTRQIPDPAAYYNLDIDKQIEFSCIAASFDQAKTRQFADFYSSINRCKALQPYIGKRQEEMITVRADTDIELLKELKREGAKIQKDISKFRVLPLAANADTLRGSASIMIVFDEMAFMMPGESRSSAQECYQAAEPSLAQFGHHAMVFCNSSPYTRIGQFYTQFMQAMQSKEHRDGWYQMRFAIQWPSWALYDKWWMDPDRKWRNAIMVSPDWDDQVEPDVPESLLDEKNLTMREAERLKEKASPDSYKVEYRGQWAEVLDAYLRPEMVDLAFNGKKPDGTECRRTFGGTYRFAYLAHCDPASTTAGFGFAIGHVEEFPDETGLFPDKVARHVVFDLVRRWNPQEFPGGTINYLTVRKEITELINLYRPAAVTFDQYNSRGLIDEIREDLRKMSIQETRIGEVTATQKVNWNRWEAFKTAIYLGLVHVPPDCIITGTQGPFDHSEYAKQELKFLQEVQTGQTKRVEKQELGPIQTKDIADCYTPGHEVLTEFGWRPIESVDMHTRVATRNPQGELEWNYPIDRVARKHRGEIWEYDNGRLAFSVTPGHNMLVDNLSLDRRGQTRLESISRLTGRLAVPLVAKPLGLKNGGTFGFTPAPQKRSDQPDVLPVVGLDDFAAFVGIWLAEGRKIKDGQGYSVRLTQTKPEGIHWIDALFVRLGWPIQRSVRRNGETEWIVKSVELREFLARLQRGDDLTLPTEFRSWPISARESLLGGLLVGDGTWSSKYERYIRFETTSRTLADDVQELLALTGRVGQINKVREKGTLVNLLRGKPVIARRDGWSVTIDHYDHATLDTSMITRRPYDGMVYCLTVPNHTLLVRHQDRVFWCGNCIAEVTVKFLGSYVGDMLEGRFNAAVTFGAEGGYQVGGRQEGGAMGGGGMPGENSRLARRGRTHPGFDNFYGRRGNGDHSSARGIRPRRRGS